MSTSTQNDTPADRSVRLGLTNRDNQANQNKASTDEGRALPTKQALTRREIRAEYGWSERSTARLETRGLLVPSKLFGKRFYLRTDVEACIRESK